MWVFIIVGGVVGYWILGETGVIIGGILGATLNWLLTKEKKPKPSTKNSYPLPQKTKKIQNPEYGPGEKITTHVAGVSFEGRQEVINRIQINDGLSIMREEDNQHDHNAIKVTWSEKKEGGYISHKVGYLPRELSAKISCLFDEHCTFPGYYDGVVGKVVEINQNYQKPTGIRIVFITPSYSEMRTELEVGAAMNYPTPQEYPMIQGYLTYRAKIFEEM